MSGRPRTLVLGLELGDGELIRGWADAGMLPAFAALRERGCWGWLETTADVLHISAWPSLYTGAIPGDHGVYFTFQPEPGLQGYRRFHPGLYGRPTFWQRLDAAGRRCTVFDPPYAHPEPGFGGTFIHDWGTWAHYLAPGSTPPELLKRLDRACGRYPLGLEANDLGFAPLEPTETARRLVRSVEARARAINWLDRERPWDLLFAVFGETHAAGHYCWNAGLRGDRADLGTPMFEVYAALDRAIGALCERLDPATALVVVSGDRCGPNHSGWHLLPDVLAKLGYLARPLPGAAGGETSASGRRFDPVRALRDLLPKDFRKNLARRLPTALRDRLAQRVDTADVDWSRTRAFCLPTDLEGYIRVNLRGREPQGGVEPGPEYESVLAGISAALAELREPGADRAVVRQVLRTDAAFPGERRAWLPDLVVQWNADGPIRRVASARIGVIAGDSPDPRSGTHRGPGFVLGCGPGIAAGSTLAGANILDFAPTLLARFGAPVPPESSGRAWREFTDFSRGSTPP